VIIQGADELCARWCYARIGGGTFIPNFQKATGWFQDGEIQAAVVFSFFNGTSLEIDLAVRDGRRVPRALLHLIGDFAYKQLGAKVLILTTTSDNIEAQTFHQRLGATRVATIPGAGRNGTDTYVSILKPTDYIWSRLNGRQKRSSSSTGLPGSESAGSGNQRDGDGPADSGEPS
jgi:hypothetical protein